MRDPLSFAKAMQNEDLETRTKIDHWLWLLLAGYFISVEVDGRLQWLKR